ncbi:ABC transporter substrate-binding protein [Pseudonocardia acaciae]|uniref:ABC transporter substrate-binding protein n=1 Tax=Pseudonocardia acaciae TaxID=551276 RepID=UPI00048EEC95|nr:ABC transporter substrate-binding protein [Pseudonocardia acaciae]
MLDDTGAPVTQTFHAPPARVVVIGQNLLETMIDFGLADRIVGIAYLDGEESPHADVIATLPKLAKELPSAEAVLARHPDLILSMSFAMTSRNLGTVATWNALGVGVVLADNYAPGRDIGSFFADVRAIGLAFDITDRTEAYLARERSSLDRTRSVAATAPTRPRVLLISKGGTVALYNYYSPPLSLVDDLVGIAGGTYLEPFRELYAPLSLESIITIAPDVIVLTQWRQRPGAAELLGDERLRLVPAIRDGRVLTLDYPTAVGGTVRLGEVADGLARFLHPELAFDR